MCPSAQECAAWVAAISRSPDRSADLVSLRQPYTDLEDGERDFAPERPYLTRDEVEHLRHKLARFYRRVAPHKLSKMDSIVADFVGRGATRSELGYLNEELLAVYGLDLDSVSFSPGQSSRSPYTDLEEQDDNGPTSRVQSRHTNLKENHDSVPAGRAAVERSAAKNSGWQAVSAALASPESNATMQRKSSSADLTSPNGPQRKSLSLTRRLIPGRGPPTLGLKLHHLAKHDAGSFCFGIPIAEVVPGSSAEESGEVEVGDLLHSCNLVPIASLSPAECEALLAGAEGSRCQIDIYHQPPSPPFPSLSPSAARTVESTVEPNFDDSPISYLSAETQTRKQGWAASGQSPIKVCSACCKLRESYACIYFGKLQTRHSHCDWGGCQVSIPDLTRSPLVDTHLNAEQC